MGLEVATRIADLVATNPTAGDPKAQGDDHIRMLKSILQTEFNPYSISANGYATMPGGTIWQWGSVITSGSADVNITFPVAFTTAMYAIVPAYVNAAGSGNVTASFGQATLTTIPVGAYVGSTGSRASASVYFIAIGK
jgi:hypothetical protein